MASSSYAPFLITIKISKNYPKILIFYPNKNYVIGLSVVERKNQSSDGGWRWHKWGQYIGKYEPKCEYLYDEESIDYVYCFTILEIEECQ